MVRDISPFIVPDLDPVSTTYLARTIDLAERGDSGINYLIVLNCLLRNMTIPIIKRILAGYKDLPFLATAYDGFKKTNTITRLEAFVHQVRLYPDELLQNPIHRQFHDIAQKYPIKTIDPPLSRE